MQEHVETCVALASSNISFTFAITRRPPSAAALEDAIAAALTE